MSIIPEPLTYSAIKKILMRLVVIVFVIALGGGFGDLLAERIGDHGFDAWCWVIAIGYPPLLTWVFLWFIKEDRKQVRDEQKKTKEQGVGVVSNDDQPQRT